MRVAQEPDRLPRGLRAYLSGVDVSGRRDVRGDRAAVGREVRPGRYTQSDVDYRKALNYPLASSASKGNAVEAKLERYHHNYGSFLWKADAGGDTPPIEFLAQCLVQRFAISDLRHHLSSDA